jgi:hypothetical protein
MPRALHLHLKERMTARVGRDEGVSYGARAVCDG